MKKKFATLVILATAAAHGQLAEPSGGAGAGTGGGGVVFPITVVQGGTGLTAGTSGGIPYYSSTSAMTSSGALTANSPVIGGGAGVAPTVGTRSGNTTEFGTIAGTKTANKQLAFDASGNIIASASDIGGAGHTQNTDTGTTSTAFQIDSDASGPKLVNDSGGLVIKTSADAVMATLSTAGVLTLGDGTVPYNLTGITDDVAPAAPVSANQFTSYVDRATGIFKIHRNGQGSPETYMTTATAVQDSQVNVKYRTHTCTFNIADPATADSGKYKCQIPVAATITYIACHTDTGSVATVNVDKRSSGTPGTSGTNVMSSSVACSSTPATGTITSASVTARDWLTLTNGSPASTPTVLTVSVEYTVN